MRFFKKHKGRIAVAMTIAILIFLIGLTSSRDYRFGVVGEFIGGVFSPVQQKLYESSNKVKNFFDSIKNISELEKENERLTNKVLKLEEENRIMINQISNAEYLKNTKKLKEERKYNYLEAKVVGKDNGNWFNRFVINKGSKDGVRKNDPVILGKVIEDENVEVALVGKVIEVSDTWSRVISIVDQGSNVSFKIVRTQDNGIVSGNLEEKVSGFLFDEKADILEGDKVITSGMGEVFIEGLYIGEVETISKKSGDLVKKLEVKSPINFKKINDVMVIIPERGN